VYTGRALLVCALLVVGAAGPASQSSAAPPELAGTILVSRPVGIVLVQPMTGDTSVLPLGSVGAIPQGVAWSADRQQMAVSVRMREVGERVGGADILVLDTGGIELSNIRRDQPDISLTSPAWLPSGEIVYERVDVSGSPEPSRIEASQPDGSARRMLVSNAHLPGPSPDGGRLAYVAPGQPFDRLMILDLATNGAHPLVENSTQGYVYFSRPRFSPDGQVVAFGAAGGPNLSRIPRLASFGAGLRGALFAAPRWHGPGWDVWSIGADGAGLRQVTQFDYEDDLAVSWSPDGQSLAAFGPNALYLVPFGLSGPPTPIGRGGLGEPDWAASELVPPPSPP
jgi:Tol biopolymer transport system component